MAQTIHSGPGIFYGVGVGPGDPELLTLKAQRIIQLADVVCFIVSERGTSQAKHIARNALHSSHYSELPIVMPMCQDRSRADAVYDQAAAAIAQRLAEDQNVVFLCEGDPLFFGSFAYLLTRLQPLHRCEVVPGITSPGAAAALVQRPLAMLAESYVVVSGRHSDELLHHTLVNHDSVVIMKAGRARQRILALLDAAGRTEDACYLEYVGHDDERVVQNMATLAREAEPGPYFSLFVVTRRERP